MSGYNAEIGGFVIAPDVIIDAFGLVTACIYGKIWRYEQMADNVCKVAITNLAKDLGISYNTVITHIEKLVNAGYVRDLTPALRNMPHIYKTTGKLKLELSVTLSAHQNLTSECSSKIDECSSKFGDESEDNDKGFIFSLYESTIGFIPANLVDDLKDAANEYPREWLDRAFKIASENNARNWRYVRRVLENIKAKGIDWTPSQKSVAEPTPATELPAPVKAVPPPAYLKEAWAKAHPKTSEAL